MFDLRRKTAKEKESNLFEEFMEKNKNFRERNHNLNAQSAESEVKATERDGEGLSFFF